MFGDLKNNINKAKEELSIRMQDAQVKADSPSDGITVIANGNREIIDLKISPSMYDDKEQLEDELIITLNKALEKAQLLFDEEMKTVMKNNMPSIPGLDGLLD